MTTQTAQRLLDVEHELGVLEWRFAQFRAAGFEESDACELAARSDIDLHAALDLLAHGCSHELALRILW